MEKLSQIPFFLAMALSLAVVFGLFVLVALRDLHRLLGPAYFYTNGQLERSRRLAARPFWMKKLFPSVRLAAEYNQAACLLMEGRLEESLDALAALPDRADRNLRAAIAEAKAGALVLLERDPEDVVPLIERAQKTQDTPGHHLTLAHAQLSLGDEPAADRHFEEAKHLSAERLKLGIKSTIIRSKGLEDTSDAFLRGWYLVRKGCEQDAQEDLRFAAGSPVKSVYQQRAQQLLG